MTARGAFLFAFLALVATAVRANDRAFVLVVVGAEGTPEFGEQFREWADSWQTAASAGHAECTLIGLEETSGKSDRELLLERIASLPSAAMEPLWIILIGHGTYDGKSARFNLRGADITPADLKERLAAMSRPVAVVNCTSSSAPFLAELSAPNRVVITATKSGHEYNFARFGGFMSKAIANPKADLDKDGQTSLLEAYLLASADVREFYTGAARLATESALLDDNGDGMGTPADWYQGLRPVKSATNGQAADGSLASTFVLVRSETEEQLPEEIRVKRDDLEQKLAELRKRKSELAEEEYFKQLEPILVDLARLYEKAEQPDESQTPPAEAAVQENPEG